MIDLRLLIAGFAIDITNKSNHQVELEEGYEPFLSQELSLPASVQVNAYSDITEELRQFDSPIYSADFEGNRLWQIATTIDGFRIHVYSPVAPFGLQQVADLSKDFLVWDVYSNPMEWQGETKLFPLLYPLGPLVMYYLTVKFDAVMIHGSGISDSGIGRIFTGVSGQGKTTMAKLWFDAGAEVLNDDRLIVRKTETGYRVFNTPMFYKDQPRSAYLKSIYSIRHASANSLEPCNNSEAVISVAANLIQHGYSQDITSHHLNFLDEMIQSVSVHKFGFVPNEDVVEKIRNQSNEDA